MMLQVPESVLLKTRPKNGAIYLKANASELSVDLKYYFLDTDISGRPNSDSPEERIWSKYSNRILAI